MQAHEILGILKICDDSKKRKDENQKCTVVQEDWAIPETYWA
jgi:hypothetical protein